LGAVGLVDDLVETWEALLAAGATVVSPLTEVATGHNLFTCTPGDVIIEWVQWTAT
jgi:uncharacterized glyoxalase superfamily protein PhnB